MAAEALAVAVLVLAGLVQGLRFIGRRNWGIEVEDSLHGLEWSGVDVDSATVRGFGDGLEDLRLL